MNDEARIFSKIWRKKYESMTRFKYPRARALDSFVIRASSFGFRHSAHAR
jgi:hypothetical protein